MASWKVTILAKSKNEREDLSSDRFALTINSSKIKKNEGKGEVYIRDDRHRRRSDTLVQKWSQLECAMCPSIK